MKLTSLGSIGAVGHPHPSGRRERKIRSRSNNYSTVGIVCYTFYVLYLLCEDTKISHSLTSTKRVERVYKPRKKHQVENLMVYNNYNLLIIVRVYNYVYNAATLYMCLASLYHLTTVCPLQMSQSGRKLKGRGLMVRKNCICC